jgi:hypothetical protein
MAHVSPQFHLYPQADRLTDHVSIEIPKGCKFEESRDSHCLNVLKNVHSRLAIPTIVGLVKTKIMRRLVAIDNMRPNVALYYHAQKYSI